MAATDLRQSENIPQVTGPLGAFVEFKNGRSSPDRTDSGAFAVFGSNGEIGKADVTNAPEGTLVIGRVGSYCGSVHYSTNKCWVTDNAIIGSSRTQKDSRFWYYKLSSLDLNNYRAGSGQPLLNQQILNSIQVSVPASEDDRFQIAKTLAAFDSKIDLNRRINQTLEAMAQAIFKSWFVDFDPVRARIAAKAEGRDSLRTAMSAISGKLETELDALLPEQYEQLAAIAALFPDEMEESELGEIPKGWSFKSVADIAEFATGKVEVSSLTQDLYISTENMLENRAGITRATSLPSVVTVPSFKVGHILISNIRPYFKKIWMARFDGGRSADVLAFEPADFQWTEFAYNLMYQDAFFEFMTRTAKGAKMPRGDKDAIMGWRFPCPDEPLMVAFSAKFRPHYAYIESLNSQNKSLSELRDSLLSKLLTGELSVAEGVAGADA